MDIVYNVNDLNQASMNCINFSIYARFIAIYVFLLESFHNSTANDVPTIEVASSSKTIGMLTAYLLVNGKIDSVLSRSNIGSSIHTQ